MGELRRRILSGTIVLFLASWICGCRTLPRESSARTSETKTNSASITNVAAVVIHTPTSKPTTCEKFNPLFWFGNMDDPVPPDWYRPKNRMRNTLWKFRNPLHNFFFYVVGIADKEFEIVGRFPGKIGNPNGGWNWTVCRYKWLRLPMISYKGERFNFYLGWRNHGNLGAKLNW
jgi:hypothetical protein